MSYHYMPLYNIISTARNDGGSIDKPSWAKEVRLLYRINQLNDEGTIWEEWDGIGAALCGRLDLVPLTHKNKTIGLKETYFPWLGYVASVTSK